MKKPIVLWGATGIARELAEFTGDVGYELVALFDNDPSRTSPIPGVPIFHGKAGLAAWLASTRHKGHAFAVAVGGDRGEDRLALQFELAAHGMLPVALVHPSAVIARSASIGLGTQVHALAYVGSAASIGAACIINAGANIGHESNIADGVHVGPGAVLCGCALVEHSAFIGAGAVLLPRIRIGANAVVGAGAVVFSDVAAGTTVVGNPAKTLPGARPAQEAAGGGR